MALKEAPLGQGSVACNVLGNVYLYTFTFTTNTTNAADGLDPTYALDAAAPTAGVHPFTFKPHTKPTAILWSSVETGIVTQEAHVSGYDAATGILSISVFLEDGVSGIRAVDASSASDDVVYQVCLLCKKGE